MKTIYVVVGLAVAALVAYLLFFNSSSGPGVSSSSGLGASTPTSTSSLTPMTPSGPTYNTYIEPPAASSTGYVRASTTALGSFPVIGSSFNSVPITNQKSSNFLIPKNPTGF